MEGFDSGMTGSAVKAALEKSQAQVLHVDEFGAVGDGVADDTAAIQSAISATPQHGVLEFAPGAIYLCSDEIGASGRHITLVGNDATLKRAPAQQTTLADPATDGVTTINVSDAAALGVEVGGQIILVDTSAPNGGRADGEEAGPFTISSIVGNTLTLDSAVGMSDSKSGDSQWDAGATVLKVYAQIRQGEDFQLHIYNMRFDGNRSNNAVHQGWTVNPCIARVGRGSVISGCTVHSMPNEGLFLGHWCTVTNCTAYDLNGSFTHTSSAPGQADPSGAVILSNNRIARAGEVGPGISEHSEGVFTWSSSAGKVVVEGNVVENCIQGFTGVMNDIGELVMTGNLVKNVNGILQVRGLDKNYKNIVISNNVFDTCLWLLFDPNDDGPIRDKGIEGVTISGNEFFNTRLHFNNASHLSITGNKIIWQDDFDPVAVEHKFLGGQTALVVFSAVSNVKCADNVIEDQKTSVNLVHGAIEFAIGVALNSGPSTATAYNYYGRNMNFANNTILNFINGIYHLRPQGQGLTGSTINFVIEANSITLRESAVEPGEMPSNNDKVGIRGFAGMVIKDNVIYCAPTTQHGIRAMGVNVGAKDELNGEVIIGNVILGQPDHSIDVGLGVGAPNKEDNSWNMTVVNNVTQIAVEDNNPTQNTVAGNTQVFLTTQEFEIQPVRANPDWY